VRIAQVAPLHESVPPKAYGGTERVVHYLTEALVALGHEVTLFASGDSQTSARLVPVRPRALRLDPDCQDRLPHHIVLLEKVIALAPAFDFIHFHVDYLHFPLSRRAGLRHVTTLHGRLDIPDLDPLYREFRQMPLVSISDAQRAPLPWANWRRTIYHGLPADLLRPGNGHGGYLAFLGRISPEKRVDRAIEIAQRVGLPLKIAAKVDTADRAYFDETIRPLLDDPRVELLGEIGEAEKNHFLGNAAALLFPIDWPEPFGLVMIEAMACGTPVIAFRGGSVDEVIDDGVTGFVVETIDAAVDAVTRLRALDRRRCRQVFEQRFTARRMAEDYVTVFDAMTPQPAESIP